jgi:two-component system cell cycle response regulator CpdR
MIFGQVQIVAWLNENDRPTGREVFDEIEPLGKSFDPPVEVAYHSIATADELLRLLDALGEEYRRERRTPLLHLETHGAKDGIEARGEEIGWRKSVASMRQKAFRFTPFPVAPLCRETCTCPWPRRRGRYIIGVHSIFTRHPAYWLRGQSRGSRPSMSTAMSKILLAEDDTDMRRFLVKALQTAGYEVVSYDNGLSAYERLREEPFELLLTDIVMPEMDGIELARRASELDPDIKIMFITGFAAVALNSDSAAPKNAKVLSKPVHLRDLVNEVQKMLAA